MTTCNRLDHLKQTSMFTDIAQGCASPACGNTSGGCQSYLRLGIEGPIALFAWNNRAFESVSSGALMICDECAGLREEFGDAIVFNSGGEETSRLIAYYLEHQEERRRIGETGRRIGVTLFRILNSGQANA